MPSRSNSKLSESATEAMEFAADLVEKIIAKPPAEALLRTRNTLEVLETLRADDEAKKLGALYSLTVALPEQRSKLYKQLPEALTKLLRAISNLDLIDRIDLQGFEERNPGTHTEQIRKMLLAMVSDGRIVIVKLADHLAQLRCAKNEDEEWRITVAQRTRRIYAPLANRMGVWQLKWELEDLSFRYLHPKTYADIAKSLNERRVDREQYIQDVQRELTTALAEHDIVPDISGRPKHIYSIWRKMFTKQLRFEEVYDVRALRVIVETIPECYSVLGVVHTLWTPVPGEFDDYIASPKSNFYRSLHTAVMGPGQRTIEVQIRTREMHEHSELGVASHWRYKEGNAYDEAFEQRLQWLRRLLEQPDDEPDSLLEHMTDEVLADRVYVLTPRGDVVDLPKGATALDFAYHIHTDIGHRCRGAKINGHIIPLTDKLDNGQQVEIITAREGAPSRDWLNPERGYLYTNRARTKVRHWFMSLHREENIQVGREVLERELKRLAVTDTPYETLAAEHGYKKTDDFLAALGRGDLTASQIAHSIQQQNSDDANEDMPLRISSRTTPPPAADGSVQIQGIGNLLNQMAKCCRPIPGDPLRGYITRGRGVTVHRADCNNILRLAAREPARILEVSWGNERHTYPVNILVHAWDRPGLLRDISSVLANDAVNVRSVNSETDQKTQFATFTVAVETTGLEELSGIMQRIEMVPNVQEVKRQR